MIPVPSFINSLPEAEKRKPWLIVGKGPSFDKLSSLDFEAYCSLALNHAVNARQGFSYVHVTDFDVFDKIKETLSSSSTKLVVPYFLHSENKPSKLLSVDAISNDQSKKHNDLFLKLLKEHRLFTYNSTLSKNVCKRKDLGKPVIVKYFSGVVAVNLLGQSGVKQITLVGIDGGNSYSGFFSGLTPLTNGRKNFDVQFNEIKKSIKQFGLNLERISRD